MTINLHLPTRNENMRPTITVVGVGGAGGNAVNNMIASHLEGISFVVANTDAQALDNALTDRVIQLGANITQGLGAGASPDVGRASAEEAYEEIMAHIEGSHMVFITAGMGGGTGTGAAPVVARMARERGMLTVAVVTKPFHFEGTHRMKLAEAGLEELQKYVDTMIVIPNQNLFRIANEKTTFADAFRMADEVLHSGVRGVTDLMIMPGLINLDFADIRAVMREMGKAMMGTGEATGERRAVEAAEAAISNPLLDDVSMKGARGVLINITGGRDMTLFEVDEAANRIRDEVDPDANIIFGSTFNDALEGKIRISVVATGIDQQQYQPHKEDKNEPIIRTFSQRPDSFMKSGFGRNFVEQEVSTHYGATAAETMMREQQQSVAHEATLPMQEAESSRLMFNDMREAAPQPAREVLRQGRHSPTRAEAVTAPRQPEVMMQSQQEPPVMTASQPVSAMPSLRGDNPRASQKMRTATAQTQPDLWQQEEEQEASDQPGLFKRMTARFTPREDQQPIRRSEVTSSHPTTASDQAGDYLEIPAFLRRQAN